MPSRTYSVSFETSGFRKVSRQMGKISDEADNSGSKLKTAGKVGAAAVAGIATAATAAVAGIGGLIKKTTEYARQVDNAAEQSGIARDRIQEIAFAAEQTSGASFDTVRDGLKELAIRSEEAANGTGEAQEAFEELGISQSELESMSTAETFERVRQELQGASKQTRIFASEMIFGGEAGEKLVETLGLSSDEMERLSKQARASGKVLSGEQVQALEQSRQAWSALWSQIQGVGRQIAVGLTPVVQRAVPHLRSMVSWVRDLFSGVDGEALSSGLSTAVGWLQEFWSWMETIGTAGLDLWAAFVDDVSTIWSEWGGFVVEQAKSAWENVLSIFRGVFGVISGLWDTLVGVLVGNWTRAWQGIKQVVTSAALTVAQAITGLVESILNTLSALASKVPGVGDTISAGLETARASVESFRKSIQKANAEASGLQEAWEGFTEGSFEGGVGGVFNTGGGPAAPNTSVGGGATIGATSGSASAGQDETLIDSGFSIQDIDVSKEVDEMREKLGLLGERGKKVTGILNRGFNNVFSGVGQITSSLITGREKMRSFGRVAVRALESVISKLTAMIAKMAVMKSLKLAFNIGTGGAGGIIGGVLGLAKGGIVTGPTLAVVGEGREDEAVMPLSKLNQVINQGGVGGGTVRGAGTARIAQGQIKIPVEVVERATREGQRRLTRTGR